MFKPDIRVDGEKLHFTTNSIGYPEAQVINLQVGIIEKVEQHFQTVYVKGTDYNVIAVNVGNIQAMKVLHEYSHEIPTWMKQDFERFLNCVDKETEKLKKLNKFMRDRLEWFAANSFNADEAYRVHQQALEDLAEYEKELEDEEQEDSWIE